MDIANTVMMLAKDPQLVAWRSAGCVIRVTGTLKVERCLIPKPYPWRPSFADLVASDWQFGTVQQLASMVQQALPEGSES